MQRVDYLARRLVHPGERIRQQAGEVRHLAARLRAAWQRSLEDSEWETAGLAGRLREGARRTLESAAALFGRLEASLRHLNPQSVLERGYSITATSAGRIIRDSAELARDDDIRITFARGWASARVRRKAGDSQ